MLPAQAWRGSPTKTDLTHRHSTYNCMFSLSVHARAEARESRRILNAAECFLLLSTFKNCTFFKMHPNIKTLCICVIWPLTWDFTGSSPFSPRFLKCGDTLTVTHAVVTAPWQPKGTQHAVYVSGRLPWCLHPNTHTHTCTLGRRRRTCALR